MAIFSKPVIVLLAVVAVTATLTAQSKKPAAMAKPAPKIGGAEAQKQRYLKARTEASMTGQAGPAVKAYLASLPKVQGLYVVEGDMLMSDSEVLHSYLAQKTAAAKPGPELKLNKLPSGADDIYPRDSRQLTYAVDRSSFPAKADFEAVVTNMQKATKQWEDSCLACGIKFVHQADKDSSPSTSTVNFVVRRLDTNGQYIAAAFFPHDPPLRRFLNIDPSYFRTSFDKTGVLRHELGHVLGYRHEHIENVPGCYSEGGNWRPLSRYDAKSVMHYFCGGGGSLELDLSPVDIQSHKSLYGS